MNSLKSIFTLVAAVAFSLSAMAQQPASATKKQEPQKAASVTQVSPKDQWVKQYNDWQPKIEKYMARVKENGDKYPEFTKEVKELSQLSSAYNQKIARWDVAKPDVKDQYAEMMNADAKKVNEQMAKVKDMYDKNWPAAGSQEK